MAKKGCNPTSNCSKAEGTLQRRPLLTSRQANCVQIVFKVLANDTRIRLLHALIRAEELCVSELSQLLGMRPQAVSNQLQRLLDLRMVTTRRSGNNIYYRIVNQCVEPLLDLAVCLTASSRSTNRATSSDRKE